jgi:endonuclease/exonuclease/phosphatase family metal-dependent hydrolase
MSLTLRRLDHKKLHRYEDTRDLKKEPAATQPASTQPATTQTTDQGARDPSIAYGARTRFAHESGAHYRAHVTQTHMPPPATAGSDTMHVGSYNIAGGAKKEYRNDYGRTHALAAHEVTRGDSDALALQEVQVGRTVGRDNEAVEDAHQDYNEQVLVHTYLQNASPDLKALDGRGRERYDDINMTSVDANGRVLDKYDPNQPTMRYSYTRTDGKHESVTVQRTSLDAQGNPMDRYDPNAPGTKYTATKDGQPLGPSMTINKESVAADGTAARDPNTGKPIYSPQNNPVTVYSANIEGGGVDKNYTMVYGKTLDLEGGRAHFGNAALLGPKNEIKRDENGAIAAGQIRFDRLNEGSDKEARFALGVKMQHEGRDVTFVSTHLTAGSSTGEGDARRAEYRQLEGFVNDFGGGRAVVAGDFNSEPGDSYGPGNNRRYPGLGLEKSEKKDGNGIDHILVSPGLDIGETDTHEDRGRSDHDLIEADVTLPS